MKIKQVLYSVICLFAFLLCYAPLVLAASTLTVSGVGEGVFLLQGIGVDNVAALDITITYDTALLTNPRVVMGELVSGAMSAINPNVSGTIRMAIIRTNPIRGSGVIATLTFDRKGESPGRMNALSARLTDINGANLPVVVQVVNPKDTSGSSLNVAQNQGPSSPETPIASSVSPQSTPPQQLPGGIVVMPQQTPGQAQAPSDAAPREEQGERPAAATPPAESRKEPAAESPAAPQFKERIAAAPKPKTEKMTYTQKSVLDRFYEYKGERSAKKFTALFEQDGMIGFRQDPAAALSDGTSLVHITFIAPAGIRKTPEVSLKGATLVSVKKDPNNTNTWVVSVKPDAGEYAASLTIPQENVTMVYPVIVAPKADVDLNKSGTVTEEDFTLFLKERGTEKKPKFDLNKDGKRDAVDDYVFTANYLSEKDKPQIVKRTVKPSKPSAAKKRGVK